MNVKSLLQTKNTKKEIILEPQSKQIINTNQSKSIQKKVSKPINETAQSRTTPIDEAVNQNPINSVLKQHSSDLKRNSLQQQQYSIEKPINEGVEKRQNKYQIKKLSLKQNNEQNYFFKENNKYLDLQFIHSRISSKIQSGLIQISPEQQKLQLTKQQYKNRTSSKHHHDTQIDKEATQIKIREIEQKKQKMIHELQKLYDQQIKVRIKRKSTNLLLLKKDYYSSLSLSKTKLKLRQNSSDKNKISKNHKSPTKLQTEPTQLKLQSQMSHSRSYFTSQQKQRIYSILKNQNQKQAQYRSKIKQLVQNIEQQRKKSLQTELKVLQMQKQKRRQKIIQRHQAKQRQKREFMQKYDQKMKLKTQPTELSSDFCTGIQFQLDEEKSDISNNHSNITHLRSPKRRYLYREYSQIDMSLQKQRKKQQQLMLLKRKQSTRFDFSTLHNHIRNYKKVKQQQIQQERQKIDTFRQQQKSRVKQIRQKFGFLTKIKEIMLQEEKQSIQKFQEQIKRKQQYRKRMNNYTDSVKISRNSRLKNQNIHGENLTKRIKTSLSEHYLLENRQKNKNIQNRQKQQAKIRNKVKENILIEYNEQTPVQHKRQVKSQMLQRMEPSVSSKRKVLKKIQMQKVNKDYLEDMRKQNRKSSQGKQQKMIKILKQENSSMSEIKKALQIFNDLNSTYWKSSSNRNNQNKARIGKSNKSKGQIGINQKTIKYDLYNKSLNNQEDQQQFYRLRKKQDITNNRISKQAV